MHAWELQALADTRSIFPLKMPSCTFCFAGCRAAGLAQALCTAQHVVSQCPACMCNVW